MSPTFGTKILDHLLCDKSRLRLLLGCRAVQGLTALELGQRQHTAGEDQDNDEQLNDREAIQTLLAHQLATRPALGAGTARRVHPAHDVPFGVWGVNVCHAGPR